jgi:hypothetical protein
MWWNDGTDVYGIPRNAKDCDLKLSESATLVRGTFACSSVTTESGSAEVEISEGSFQCLRE